MFRRTRTRRQVDAHMVSHWRFGSTWKTRTIVLLLWFVLDLLSDICHWRPSETRTDLMDCSRWITHATISMQQKTSSAQLDCCLLGSPPDGFASTMIFSDGSKWPICERFLAESDHASRCTIFRYKFANTGNRCCTSANANMIWLIFDRSRP